jgi:hypothetical protein
MPNLVLLRQQLDDECFYGPTDNARDVCDEVFAVLCDPAIRAKIGDYANVLSDRLDLLMCKLDK